MKHSDHKEHQFFRNTKKKYHGQWYFFFFTPLIVGGWYYFCITPFLLNPETPVIVSDCRAQLHQKAQQEALLVQAKSQSFTQDKLIALSEKANDYDVKLIEYSIQDRSVQKYLTKTTLFLKMEGDYADIAQFLDSIPHDFLCTIDLLQLSFAQEGYQASVILSCATLM